MFSDADCSTSSILLRERVVGTSSKSSVENTNESSALIDQPIDCQPIDNGTTMETAKTNSDECSNVNNADSSGVCIDVPEITKGMVLFQYTQTICKRFRLLCSFFRCVLPNCSLFSTLTH